MLWLLYTSSCRVVSQSNAILISSLLVYDLNAFLCILTNKVLASTSIQCFTCGGCFDLRWQIAEHWKSKPSAASWISACKRQCIVKRCRLYKAVSVGAERLHFPTTACGSLYGRCSFYVSSVAQSHQLLPAVVLTSSTDIHCITVHPQLLNPHLSRSSIVQLTTEWKLRCNQLVLYRVCSVHAWGCPAHAWLLERSIGGGLCCNWCKQENIEHLNNTVACLLLTKSVHCSTILLRDRQSRKDWFLLGFGSPNFSHPNRPSHPLTKEVQIAEDSLSSLL